MACRPSSGRRSLGSLKDMVSLAIAQVNSAHAEVDVAVIKATKHNHRLPKEKHIKTAIAATSPYAEQTHLASVLADRLSKTHNWMVALKTLTLIHRSITEGHHSFALALQNSPTKRVVQAISHFMDNSSSDASEISLWIQNYSLYLAEKIMINKPLNYDMDNQKSVKITIAKCNEGELKDFKGLQMLMDRLLQCIPKPRRILKNALVQHVFELLATDSSQIHASIQKAMSQMSRSLLELTEEEAAIVGELYKKNVEQVERLSEFYGIYKGIFGVNNIKIPTLDEPPKPFMEAFIRSSTYRGTTTKTEFQVCGAQPWVPDHIVSKCAKCKKDFSVIVRKHHCRSCGHVFCANCTTGRIISRETGGSRVCDGCLAMYKRQFENQREEI